MDDNGTLQTLYYDMADLTMRIADLYGIRIFEVTPVGIINFWRFIASYTRGLEAQMSAMAPPT